MRQVIGSKPRYTLSNRRVRRAMYEQVPFNRKVEVVNRGEVSYTTYYIPCMDYSFRVIENHCI